MDATIQSLSDAVDSPVGLGLAFNVTQDDSTVVAQNIMCAYPISDIYAPTPRYLYYCLLFFTFVTLRFRWLSNIFLGAAVAYAASAAIHAIIIVSSPPKLQNPSEVSIPFISASSNLTSMVESLITNTTKLTIQPDAVELDIDPITAVVVTAYLIGLPLQIWSRTMRSSNMIRYMILLWNLCMLVGTICALISWPTTNLAAPQFRFCYAGFLDADSLASERWDDSYWRGNWNVTIWNIFDHPDTVWQALSNNCFYPCFNTSQAIRQSSSLKAVVTTGSTKFAKLHDARHGTDDEFQPILYVSIVAFSAAQFFLYLVSNLRIGSDAMRETILEPYHLWRKRRKIWQQLTGDAQHSWSALVSLCCCLIPSKRRDMVKVDADQPPNHTAGLQLWGLISTLRLIVDIVALMTLVAGITLSPVIVVAFICWIEWYIRNDGSTNETIRQVGQWAPLVSVAVVLFATLLYQLKGHLASAEEIRLEIWKAELHVRKLKGQLEEKGLAVETYELR